MQMIKPEVRLLRASRHGAAEQLFRLGTDKADGKRYPYILIGIIEKQRSARNYTTWIRSRSEIIRKVSAIVYKGVIARHTGA
jgi:hypothetical protein